MIYYISPTNTRPFFAEIHFFKMVLTIDLQSLHTQGFGVYDQDDNLMGNFDSHQAASNYCMENDMRLAN